MRLTTISIGTALICAVAAAGLLVFMAQDWRADHASVTWVEALAAFSLLVTSIWAAASAERSSHLYRREVK